MMPDNTIPEKEVFEIPKERIQNLQDKLNKMKDIRIDCQCYHQPTPILDECILQLSWTLNYLTQPEDYKELDDGQFQL